MDPELIDGANAGFVMVCAFLVLLMIPGLAFLYGGMSRSKNVLNMMMMSFSAIAIVSVLWVLYGYSLAFGTDRNGLVGFSGGLLGLSDLTDNATFGSVEAGADGVVNTYLLPDLVFAGFQLMFAVITVALISGAVADRMKFGAWLAFVAVWASVVYFPVAHWVFAFGVAEEGGEAAGFANGFFAADTGGWIVNRLGAFDLAGGTAVHINAGAAALALILVLGRRRGFRKEPMRPHNLPFVMLGAGLLWFGWFGFNVGSTLGATAYSGLVLMNTQVATAAAILGWLVIEKMRDGHMTSLGAASGAVAGLVAITPACGFVNAYGAIAIGLLSGIACALAVTLKNRLGYDDAFDVVGVHLVGGLVGTLMIGVVGDSTHTLTDSLFFGGSLGLLGTQAIAAFAVLAYSFTVTFVIALLLKAVMGIRVSDEEEITGIDQMTHAETAYEIGGGITGGGTTTPAAPRPSSVEVSS
ncbi:MAG: ammonium transporter [Actinomycetota bacterium]|nr:ammonium transporter [Actinomycetota bacterium]